MIVKVTVIIGRTTPEMRVNISAKIKITMSSIFWIKLCCLMAIKLLPISSLIPKLIPVLIKMAKK
jgi:hypothetical protein